MKRLFTIFICIAFTSQSFWSQTATAPTSGDGAIGTPYEISTLENLYWIAYQVNSGANTFNGKYFIQTADIDASGTSSWNSGAGWTPIGNVSISMFFLGTYNGNNYKISGLTINRPTEDYVGLFSILVGNISSLSLTNTSITGLDYVGGITGALDSYNIEFCSSSGNVSGRFYIGGITGYNYAAHIKYSYSTCTITGHGVVGGIAGQNEESTIEDCYASGNVTASGNYVGCGHSGGLVGFNYWGSINRCYATGLVSCTYISTGFYGGLVGRSDYGTTTFSFWDTQTTGQASSPDGGTGKITADMKTQSTFIGWNFTTIWQIQGGDGANYPDLRSNSNSALPVELTSFTANVNENEVTLNWQTATELNNYGFQVERQILKQVQNDESIWEKVGFVEGHGNSNSQKDYTFTDNLLNLNLSLNLNYRLKQIDFDGNYEYSDEITVELGELVKEYKLEQNYPNPFNPSTTISYSIPNNVKNEMSNVKLIVYDILGNEVATLVNERQKSGNYEVKFDASNLASGIYLYKLQSGSFVQTRKLMLLK